jgi:hypothetical protein
MSEFKSIIIETIQNKMQRKPIEKKRREYWLAMAKYQWSNEIPEYLMN